MSFAVLIVDDNPVVRMGLWSLLATDEDIEVCGEASSGPQALTMARQLGPDVVLLDVRMPSGGGLEVLRELSELANVLMLTYSEEPAVVARALREGATGYLVHGAFESRELVLAIKDTAQGRARLSPSAAAVLVQDLARSGDTPPAGGQGLRSLRSQTAVVGATLRSVPDTVIRRHRLSPREVEICSLLVRGQSNVEIAAVLFIEEKTVKNHINRIFAKLHARSRSEAIATCLGTRPVLS